MTFKFYIRIT